MISPPSETNTKINDSFIVTKRGIRAVYNVEEQDIYCHPVITTPFRTAFVGFDLPWEEVGVHRQEKKETVRQPRKKCLFNRFERVDYSRKLRIPRGQVMGKAMVCGNTISEWPKEWLNQSKKDY